MFINEKLKLNRFKKCSIPCNRDYFARYGFQVVPESSFTGDELADMPSNPVDRISKAYQDSMNFQPSDKSE